MVYLSTGEAADWDDHFGGDSSYLLSVGICDQFAICATDEK